MSRQDRMHLVNDAGRDDAADAPREISREEFGRRVYRKMLAKGWSQAELGRQAGIHRESISGYIRGNHWPTPSALDRLSKALGVEPSVLLPNHVKTAILQDEPSFEMRASSGDPTRMWVKLNRHMSMSAAVRIAAIVEEDAASRD